VSLNADWFCAAADDWNSAICSLGQLRRGKRAKQILERTGAKDISSTGETAGEKTPTTRVA
jgi:hypothetical protein